MLPVGISFFTFKAMSYVIDVYRGDFEPTTLEKFAVYLSFFPHLVAGPDRAPGELLPQLDTPRAPRRVDTSRAFCLIATGLFKKVVIANYLAANIVDGVFAAPGQHSSLEILLARLRLRRPDLRRLLRLHRHRDRDRAAPRLHVPAELRLAVHRASSVQDFWRRWHISLSRWLRDYLYIPLGGSRGGARLTYRNLMLTMLLGGLWHGASWTFVVWGGLHGTALVVERWRRSGRAWTPPPTASDDGPGSRGS